MPIYDGGIRANIGVLVDTVKASLKETSRLVSADRLLRIKLTCTCFVCGYRGCPHPGCRLCASGICPIPCAHPLPKSPLHTSVKMAFLVARISTQNDLCVQPFQKLPLCVSVFRVTKNQHLDPNIRNFGFDYWGFTSRDIPLRFLI